MEYGDALFCVIIIIWSPAAVHTYIVHIPQHRIGCKIRKRESTTSSSSSTQSLILLKRLTSRFRCTFACGCCVHNFSFILWLNHLMLRPTAFVYEYIYICAVYILERILWLFLFFTHKCASTSSLTLAQQQLPIAWLTLQQLENNHIRNLSCVLMWVPTRLRSTQENRNGLPETEWGTQKKMEKWSEDCVKNKYVRWDEMPCIKFVWNIQFMFDLFSIIQYD